MHNRFIHNLQAFGCVSAFFGLLMLPTACAEPQEPEDLIFEEVTDELIEGRRYVVVRDRDTSCHYIASEDGIVPRMSAEGQIGCSNQVYSNDDQPILN